MSRQSRKTLAILGVLSVLAMSSACTSDSPEPDATTDTAQSVPLKMMTFNIEYGGDEVDFASVSKAIEAADAEVVAVQEGYAQIPAIAEDLGWSYYDARTQVVSQYPLIAPSDPSNPEVYVQLEPGNVVAVLNVHLPSTKFGPNRAAAGESVEELIDGERHRVRAVEPTLSAAERLMSEDIPVFLVGDFNSPSHLDWTADAVGQREYVTAEVPWPTTVAVDDAGLTDMYRSVYPDPVEAAGDTWPASRPFVPGYNPGPKGRPSDRIDQMYSGGAITTTDIAIVGEEKSPITEIPVSPWPSDHRAVVATTEVTPGALGTVVSPSQRLVEQGSDIEVLYNATGSDAATLVITPQAGGDAVTSDVSDAASGQQTFATGGLEPGTYGISLQNTGGDELARTTVWVVLPDTEPTVTTNKPTYKVGEPVEVSWTGAPGNKWDWIGIYKEGADPNKAWYLMWQYTQATVEGSVVFDDAVNQWPLKAGKYSAYILADDSYVKLGGTDFEVEE